LQLAARFMRFAEAFHPFSFCRLDKLI
jgi:hypothetical protein